MKAVEVSIGRIMQRERFESKRMRANITIPSLPLLFRMSVAELPGVLLRCTEHHPDDRRSDLSTKDSSGSTGNRVAGHFNPPH